MQSLFFAYILIPEHAGSVLVNNLGSELSKLKSLNSGQLYYVHIHTNAFAKGMKPSLLYGLNIRANWALFLFK